MRNIRDNSIIILLDMIRSLCIGYWKSMQALFVGTKGSTSKESVKIFSYMDAMIRSGPKSFQKYPTAIRLGRSLFTPIILLFRKK